MTVPRLKETYNEKVAPALKEQLGVANVMQIPRLEKIVVNMGVGEAVTDRRQIESAMDELSLITGQKAPAQQVAALGRRLQGPRRHASWGFGDFAWQPHVGVLRSFAGGLDPPDS